MILSFIFSLFVITNTNTNTNINTNANVITNANIYHSYNQHPMIISHRGASGYIPEHSIPAYQLAMDLNTNYIEPDLCLSKDGVFVALHDLLLDDTTDIASYPQYSNRKRTQQVDGETLTGYFVSDFTISELKQLRVNQRLVQRTQIYNSLFEIPTLDEIINLVQLQYNKTGILYGIFPELKHPSYFTSLGFNMEDMLLEQLSTREIYNNINKSTLIQYPIVIQCFDENTLVSLKNKTDIPLILLVDTNDIWTTEYLTNISAFANGIGPNKKILNHKKIQMAHNANLQVYPWTFRADSDIGPQFNNSFEDEELYYICCLGVDGLFTEFPDRTRETINNSDFKCDKLVCLV